MIDNVGMRVYVAGWGVLTIAIAILASVAGMGPVNVARTVAVMVVAIIVATIIHWLLPWEIPERRLRKRRKRPRR